jgi:phosphoribosylamine--glycine ligase
MREIIMPTIMGMEQDGIPFTGFLYAGLMINKAGHVKTLEFNCRMGDPETQPIMMRLKSDLVDVLMAATETQPITPLQDIELQWDRQSAVGVVMASHGYPATSRSGDVISGLPADSEDAMVFHAATKINGTHVVTSGGRVLCVCALGGTLKLAQQKAYEVLDHIQFDGMQFRRDIGYRAVQR